MGGLSGGKSAKGQGFLGTRAPAEMGQDATNDSSNTLLLPRIASRTGQEPLSSQERSLWKAQHELAQTLHAEARDDINDSRASWAEEVRSLKARALLLSRPLLGAPVMYM